MRSVNVGDVSDSDGRAEVPGMAAVIGARMKELGLGPGDFAAAADLTRQGLDDVRAGVRKRYQFKTIKGVARALAWELDWYDRMLAGDLPVIDTTRAHDQEEVRKLREEVARLREIVEQLGTPGRAR